jgi:A/G-specific adenine glycosylase
MPPISMTAATSREKAATRQFRTKLLAWYDVNRRALPWRVDQDPYRIWISEIMLQQTRVAAVIDYYQRFLKKFPTVKMLAAARLSSVLALWSGLGYYRRARMLHQSARIVAREYGGKFPSCAEALRALPGIGRYTAAAIASIAFSEAVPVVDGNVKRVLQRVSGVATDGEALWDAAASYLDRERPGDFNQAMMELGATVCTPRQPLCLTCPLHPLCATRGELARTARAIRKRKELRYVLESRAQTIRLVQRPTDASLMPAMWELPAISEMEHQPSLILRHSITDSDYIVRVVRGYAAPGTAGRWFKISRLSSLPLTGLARKILRAAQVIE